MRAGLFLGWLAIGFDPVQALLTAVPWELLHFYDAYKVNFATNDMGARTIAWKCSHIESGAPWAQNFQTEATAAGLYDILPNGKKRFICSFDQFVKYVGVKGWTKFYPVDEKGMKLNPTHSDIVGKIDGAATNYHKALLYQGQNLLEKVSWTPLERAEPLHIPLPKVQQRMINALQQARAVEATLTNDVPADKKKKELINACVASSMKHLEIINGYRLKDRNEKHLIVKLKEAVTFEPDGTTLKTGVREMDPFRNHLVTPQTGEIKDHGGNLITKYEVIDWDATYTAASSSTGAERQAMGEWMSGYPTSTNTARVHQEVMQMNTWGGNLLQGASFDCPHGGAQGIGNWPPAAGEFRRRGVLVNHRGKRI